jgi:transcriptional regulator with XRE-family HTH domain
MNDQLLSIKAKKLGVTLSALRKSKGISLEALCQWTDIPQEEMEKIERGESTLSLPEIELIAIKLGLSINDLLLGELADQKDKSSKAVNEQFTILRDRMIALVLRKTRIEQNMTLEEIAQKSGINVTQMADYESGDISIPWPVLDCICTAYKIPVTTLLAQTSAPEVLSPDSKSSIPAVSIPDGMSDFIQNPANRPYLDLAKRLSELDAAKLRSIAEGLLEITY